MDSLTVRFLFTNLAEATEALLVVVTDARSTDRYYEFGSLSADQVLMSGLLLVGDVTEVAEKISGLPGATRYDE